MYAPVRGGNRGGQDQFKWDDVRLMSYKDRECYLGASERLGYLDKGGKWRSKNWWVSTNGGVSTHSFPMISDLSSLILNLSIGLQSMTDEMKKEIEQIKKEDAALMRQKLGLEDPKDTKVLL